MSDPNTDKEKQVLQELEDYGGAEFLKEFTMDLLSGPRDVPRGIFLLGPSGTGKTLQATVFRAWSTKRSVEQPHSAQNHTGEYE